MHLGCLENGTLAVLISNNNGNPELLSTCQSSLIFIIFSALLVLMHFLYFVHILNN
jgi:hypothetical protein